MKAQYVSELAIGARVDAAFVLTSKQMRRTRDGEPYLSLEFADRTGRIPGVWFRPDRKGSGIPAGAAVRVEGIVTDYRAVKRISVERIHAAESFDRLDMLPEGTQDRDLLMERFKRIAASVRSPESRMLLRVVFGDKRFLERFSMCPASRSGHHAHLGGLLEHTVAVADICDSLADQYPQVDRDLLLTAALVHDVGVVDELEWDATISQTDEGRLLGHVILGDRRLQAARARIKDRRTGERQLRVAHAVLTHHHGTGSEISASPATIEALLLARADSLDIEVSGFVSSLTGPGAVGERWTDAGNPFKRPLLVEAACVGQSDPVCA